MSFFNQRCYIMQIIVEIVPSNASQGQHIRKDATEQMKNLTLARTRTQVLGFSCADAMPSKLRVPVGRTWILIRTSIQILNSLRCLPFMWTFILDMLFLCVFFILHDFSLLIQLYNTAVVLYIYIYIYIYRARKKFNDVLFNKFYYYNYITTKIFDEPVAFLCGTMLTDKTTTNTCMTTTGRPTYSMLIVELAVMKWSLDAINAMFKKVCDIYSEMTCLWLNHLGGNCIWQSVSVHKIKFLH